MESLNPLLLDAAVKSSVILVLAAIAALGLRRSSAASRHLVWFLAMLSILTLPIFSAALPGAGWRVLPRFMDTPPIQMVTESPPSSPVEVEATPTPHGAESIPDSTVIPAPPFATRKPTALPEPSPHSARASSTPSTPRPRSNLQHLQPWIAWAWLTIAALSLGPLLVGFLSLWWLGRTTQPVTDIAWQSLLGQLAADLGLRRPVQLLKSPCRAMPMTWGVFPWMPAKILIPEDADDWSADRRRTVLLHELAHIKRHDCLTQLVTRIVCALYWFNPLAWYAAHRMMVERERACDDLVLAQGELSPDYAEHIMEIAAGPQAGRFAALAGIAMARRSQLEGRLSAILDKTRNRRSLTRMAVVISIVVIGVVVVPISIIRAKGPDNASTNPTLPATIIATLLDTDGVPLKGAEIFVTMPLHHSSRSISLIDGKNRLPDTVSMLSNSGGRFWLHPHGEQFGIVVADPRGYASAWGGQLVKSPVVTLQRWGRVKGRAWAGASPMPNETIRLVGSLQFGGNYQWDTKSGPDGSFTFDRVPPGESDLMVTRLVTFTKERSEAGVYDHGVVVELAPGETKTVTIGGAGRNITGRVLDLNGQPLDTGKCFVYGTLSIPPPKPPANLHGALIGTWLNSEEGKKAYLLSWPTWAVTVAANGTFSANDILPGEYNLTIEVREIKRWPSDWSPGPVISLIDQKVTVPEVHGGDTSPIDFGDLRLIQEKTSPSTQPATQPTTAPATTRHVPVPHLHTDAELKAYVEANKNLGFLTLNYDAPGITDEGLKNLKQLKKLRILNLFSPNLTDRGLKELEDIPSLQILSLSSPGFTDAGLKDHRNIPALSLFAPNFTDAGLKELKEFANLQWLTLASPGFTDEGMKELRGLKNLQALFLASPRFTDGGLKELKGITSLQYLVLASSGFTDAGLRELAAFTGLKTLSLRSMKITPAGVAELQKALPNLKIVVDHPAVVIQPATQPVARPVVTPATPMVLHTVPTTLTNNIDPALNKITVTFDRPMRDGSWSWIGGGETFPKMAGAISYDQARTTCTMPVKLEPGKIYWVGINSSSFQNFKSADGIPVGRQVILFATRSAAGKPTPLPAELIDIAIFETEIGRATALMQESSRLLDQAQGKTSQVLGEAANQPPAPPATQPAPATRPAAAGDAAGVLLGRGSIPPATRSPGR